MFKLIAQNGLMAILASYGVATDADAQEAPRPAIQKCVGGCECPQGECTCDDCPILGKHHQHHGAKKAYCPGCGKPVSKEYKFCPECGCACNGQQSPARPPEAPPKSPPEAPPKSPPQAQAPARQWLPSSDGRQYYGWRNGDGSIGFYPNEQPNFQQVMQPQIQYYPTYGSGGMVCGPNGCQPVGMGWR